MSFDPTKLDLHDCGLYLSYMNYYATGEGVTSCIALGGSPRHVEDLLKKHIAEYFHRLVQTVPIDRGMSEDARSMLARVPEDVKDSLRRMPCGAGQYFSEFHYNLG